MLEGGRKKPSLTCKGLNMKKKPAIKIKTVQELIDALMKIENKDLKVYLESKFPWRQSNA